MTAIGRIRRQADGGADAWEGEIATAACRFEFRLVPVHGMRSADVPSHRIVARSASGADAIVGSAWSKTMIRGDRKGERFFTLTLRHSSLARPLNVAAFAVQPDREYVVTHRLRQRRAA